MIVNTLKHFLTEENMKNFSQVSHTRCARVVRATMKVYGKGGNLTPTT